MTHEQNTPAVMKNYELFHLLLLSLQTQGPLQPENRTASPLLCCCWLSFVISFVVLEAAKEMNFLAPSSMTGCMSSLPFQYIWKLPAQAASWTGSMSYDEQ